MKNKVGIVGMTIVTWGMYMANYVFASAPGSELIPATEQSPWIGYVIGGLVGFLIGIVAEFWLLGVVTEWTFNVQQYLLYKKKKKEKAALREKNKNKIFMEEKQQKSGLVHKKQESFEEAEKSSHKTKGKNKEVMRIKSTCDEVLQHLYELKKYSQELNEWCEGNKLDKYGMYELESAIIDAQKRLEQEKSFHKRMYGEYKQYRLQANKKNMEEEFQNYVSKLNELVGEDGAKSKYRKAIGNLIRITKNAIELLKEHKEIYHLCASVKKIVDVSKVNEQQASEIFKNTKIIVKANPIHAEKQLKTMLSCLKDINETGDRIKKIEKELLQSSDSLNMIRDEENEANEQLLYQEKQLKKLQMESFKIKEMVEAMELLEEDEEIESIEIKKEEKPKVNNPKEEKIKEEETKEKVEEVVKNEEIQVSNDIEELNQVYQSGGMGWCRHDEIALDISDAFLRKARNGVVSQGYEFTKKAEINEASYLLLPEGQVVLNFRLCNSHWSIDSSMLAYFPEFVFDFVYEDGSPVSVHGFGEYYISRIEKTAKVDCSTLKLVEKGLYILKRM